MCTSHNQLARRGHGTTRAALNGVKEIRNGFQHIERYAARLAEQREAIWGYLNWFAIYPERSQFQTCLLVPGICPDGTTEFELANPPHGKPFQAPVDHVVLTAFNTRVDLSELHRQIAQVTRNLEEILLPQFDGKPHESSTHLIVLTGTFATEQPEMSTDAGTGPFGTAARQA
jgi:hypothetical protein